MEPSSPVDEEILDRFEATCRVGRLSTVGAVMNLLARQQWGGDHLMLRHPADMTAYLRRRSAEDNPPRFVVADTLSLLCRLQEAVQGSKAERTRLRDTVEQSIGSGLDDQRFEQFHGRGAGVYFPAYRDLVFSGFASMGMAELRQGTPDDWRIASIFQALRWLGDSQSDRGAALEWVLYPMFHHAVELGSISLDITDFQDLYVNGVYTSDDAELLAREMLSRSRLFQGSAGSICLIHADEFTSPHLRELALLAEKAVEQPDSAAMRALVSQHVHAPDRKKPMRELLVKFGHSLGLTDDQIGTLWSLYGVWEYINVLETDGSDSRRQQVMSYRRRLGLRGRGTGRPKKQRRS